MELILLNGSANSVVHWHVGFAGEIHTFVIHVTERQQRYLRWKQWYQRRVRGGVLVQYMNCPCPVCLRQVPISTLNEHLDLCLQQNQESPIQQPPWGPYSDMDRRREEEENERLFHAFLERDQEQTKKTETDGIKCGICLKLVPFASTFFLNIPGLVEVCSKDECLERKANVCQKTLPCGHFCNGKLPSSSIFLICFLPSETRVMPSPHTLTALLLPSSPTITPPTSPSQPSPIPHVPIQKKEK
eukprot:TRINITY_DN5426_c0_g1_i7.p1 TRINITY_DN5426_c0_g1~~TRINITY_DN5426_c0_g1_i7.p1  ORF type:complete len:244 (+),score=52.97 TRINITY_DN5426_c0_g1_i7:129-860(+)